MRPSCRDCDFRSFRAIHVYQRLRLTHNERRLMYSPLSRSLALTSSCDYIAAWAADLLFLLAARMVSFKSTHATKLVHTHTHIYTTYHVCPFSGFVSPNMSPQAPPIRVDLGRCPIPPKRRHPLHSVHPSCSRLSRVVLHVNTESYATGSSFRSQEMRSVRARLIRSKCRQLLDSTCMRFVVDRRALPST